MEVCACRTHSRAARPSGSSRPIVDAYSHNVNTAESNHDNVVQTTPTTTGSTRSAGESGRPVAPQRPDRGPGRERRAARRGALRAKALDADSIPVNFLMPSTARRTRTPLGALPARCVKILAMARFVPRTRRSRIAGGRESCTCAACRRRRCVANSIFSLGDYLTSEGQTRWRTCACCATTASPILGMDERAFDELIAAHEAGVTHRAHTRRRPAGSSAGRAAATAAAAAR